MIDLVANDSDNFNLLDLNSINIVAGPSNGTVLVNADGTVTYTHDGSESTADSFTYTIEDTSDLLSNVATVSLTITPVNGAPTVTSSADQTPLEDAATGDIAFKVGDPETAASALTVTATSDNQTLVPDGNITLGGSGFNRTINILPGLNQAGGPATITVTVDDGTTSTQTTFDVTVTAINDAPTDIALSGSAVDENSANGTIVGSVSGTDIDAGDSVTFALTDNAGGRFAVDLNTGQLTVAFSSLLNFEDSAAHTITVRATDTGGLSRDESYTITVNDVNEAPTGVGHTFSVRQLEDLVVPAGVILTNDFDADGDSLSVVLVSGPTEGAFALAADGSFTYTSAGSFSGQDEFTYYVTDGTLNSAVTTVNIDVTNSISGVGPIDSVDPETLEDPVDTTPAEDSDTTAEDSSSEETSAKDTVSGTTGSSSGQTDDSFVNGDTPDEIPQQVGSEPFISIMLVDVPEAGRLKNDSSIQRDGFEETVIGEALQLDRHLFHQVVTDNPLFGSGHVNPSDVDIHESQDDQWRKDQIVEQVVVGSTAVVTTSVSVGYVMWLLRGGSLLTTFLSSLPAWQAFDPLAVLESFNETGDENNDGESLASLVSGDI